jgi:hypothetical protein
MTQMMLIDMIFRAALVFFHAKRAGEQSTQGDFAARDWFAADAVFVKRR